MYVCVGVCEFAYFTGFPGGSLQLYWIYNAPRWLTMPLAEITVVTISIPFSMKRLVIAYYDHYYQHIISIIMIIVIFNIVIIIRRSIIIYIIMLTYVAVFHKETLVKRKFQSNILVYFILTNINMKLLKILNWNRSTSQWNPLQILLNLWQLLYKILKFFI